MAGSSIVGILKVLLTADTAGFTSGLDGAAKSTKQFTGQLTGMATQVSGIGSMLGRLFTVTAITAAAKQVMDYAGNIQDLAEQTGLTAESIQEMGFAAKQTGSSLEGFTNAAFKLGVNLAEGTSKVQGATEALGLSYEALRKLSPDLQFKAIAEALGKVESVQERNRLGVILMGKGYKETAAAINEGYDEMARRASVSSADQIKALADAGDKWDEFKGKVMNLGVLLGGSFARAMEANAVAFRQDAEFLNKYVGIVRITQQAVEDWKTIFGIAAEGPPILAASIRKNLPAALANQTLSMDEAEAKAKELDAQIEKSIETNKAAAKATDEFTKSLKALGGADAIGGAKEVLRQLEALGGPLKVLPSQLEAMADKLRDGAEAALLMGDADLAGQYTKLADTLSPIIQFQQRYNVTVGEYALEAKTAAEMTHEFWEELYRFTGQVQTIGPLLSSLDLSKMFEPFKGALTSTLTENLPDSSQWAQAWSAMRTGLSDVLGGIPQTLSAAFTGGGNILGAIKSIASQIGATIGGAIGSAFGPAGTGIGSALGSMLGVLVEKAKPLVEKLREMSTLGKVLTTALLPMVGIFSWGESRAAKEMKAANTELDKSREKLIAHYGSLERINQIGRRVGIDLAGAWYHQGKAGKEAFDKLAAAFQAAVEKMEQDLEGAVADMKDEISGLQGELDGLLGEAREMGYIFDRDGKLVSVRFEKMESTAKDFGVEVAALGPAFQNLRLQDMAGKIINAFDLLARGGADAGTILFGMKDEISKLVQESIKFKTTIPENMRPWIAELIRAGLLVDENGEKITDIGTIKFGPQVKTQFEEISTKIGDLITKIGELIDKLTNELIPALDAATRDRNVHIGITTDPMPTFDVPGGDGGGDGLPRFATGTLGRLGSFWGKFPETGMAAMLDGVEAVVTPQQAPAFAMDVLRSNGAFSQGVQQLPAAQAPINVRSFIDNRISLDGQELKKWIINTITTAIDNNERGVRSVMRDSLGVTT